MTKETTILYPSKIQIVTKRAAIYVRCSSDEVRKGRTDDKNKSEEAKRGYSPETQEEKARSLIKNEGWQLDEKHIYNKDIGYSGSTDKRPDFQRFMQAARNKEFDVAVVFRMDRFFRNLRLLLNTVAELRDLGIEFKSVTEPFDTSTPTGRAMFANMGVFAEWMREVGMESRDEGMIKAMKEGKYLGGTTPNGYKFNKEKQRLEIEPKEAETVKMVFGWLVEEKLSEYKIQQRLNIMKVPTKWDLLGRKKKTKSVGWWNRKTVDRMLTNEIYTGKYTYRKYIATGRTRNEKNLRPKEDWIEVEDDSIKIIEKEYFDRGQKQLKINKQQAVRNTKEIYALQHKVVCGKDRYRYQCAIRRNKKSGNSTKYYFCVGIRNYLTPNHCLSSTISESRIMPPVWDKLKETLTNPKLIMAEINKYINRESNYDKLQKQLGNITSAIESAHNKKERFAELYGEGSIEKTFYDQKIKLCDKDVEELKKEEKTIAQSMVSEEENKRRVRSAELLFDRLKNRLENATYEIKVEILQMLVGEVEKIDDDLKIEFILPFLDEQVPSGESDCSDNARMDRTF